MLEQYPPIEGYVASPHNGSRLAAALLRGLGWKAVFPQLPAPRGLIVVYPHTSNWDFAIGLLYKWALGMPLHFWIKESWTNIPVVGAWMRWLGAVGINRQAPTGVVEQTQRAMQTEPFFWLAVTPEGTRSYGNGWRTGFYHVWKASDCPLGLAFIDFGKREIGFDHFVQCSGDMAADFAGLAAYYQGRQGYHPEKAAPVQPFVRNAPSQEKA